MQKTKNSSRHTEKPNSLQVLQGTADSGAQATVNNSPSPWSKSSKLEILCLLLSTLWDKRRGDCTARSSWLSQLFAEVLDEAWSLTMQLDCSFAAPAWRSVSTFGLDRLSGSRMLISVLLHRAEHWPSSSNLYKVVVVVVVVETLTLNNHWNHHSSPNF